MFEVRSRTKLIEVAYCIIVFEVLYPELLDVKFVSFLTFHFEQLAVAGDFVLPLLLVHF